MQVAAYASGKTFKEKLLSALERRSNDGPDDTYFDEYVLGLCDQSKAESDFQNDELLEQCRELAPDLSEVCCRACTPPYHT